MKLRAIYFFLSLFIFIALDACDSKGDFEDETENYFIKYYGEDGEQQAVDFHINSDGTILILGSSSVGTEGIAGFKRITLIKVDEQGKILWEKKFGGGPGVLSEGPQDLEPTADGKFLILSNMYYGTDLATNESKFDTKVIRIEPDGTKIDSMVLGNNNNGGIRDWNTQFMHSITALSNGGFAITGNSTDETIFDPDVGVPSGSVDQEDIITLAFNSSFSSLWLSDPSTPGEQFGSGIKVFEDQLPKVTVFMYLDRKPDDQATENSNFAVLYCGTSESYGTYNSLNTFSGSETSEEILASVCKVPNELGGGFYEFGTAKTGQAATSGKLYFCRRTNNFTKIGEGTISLPGTNFLAIDVAPASVNEGFLILANEETTAGSTIRLAKLNNSSEHEWSINLGAFGTTNSGAKVAELPDGRILVLATIALETQRKIALIKVNRKGEFLN